MALDLWIAFAAASFVIAVIPGPGVASIIGFAVASGRRTALASVAGMALGNALAISFSLAGAGVILSASALAFTALKWAGALYLIAIGLYAIATSGRQGSGSQQSSPVSARMAFFTNVAVGTFHPKTVLFFIAFASQFIIPEQAFLPQAALLVVTFTAIAAITDTIYALTASSLSLAVRKPSVRKWSQRIGGGVIMAAGVALASTRR